LRGKERKVLKRFADDATDMRGKKKRDGRGLFSTSERGGRKRGAVRGKKAGRKAKRTNERQLKGHGVLISCILGVDNGGNVKKNKQRRGK